MSTDRRDELLEKIQHIKHNLSLLIPTTIELMFDACIGILYEDYATKRAELDAREKAGGPKSLKLGLLRANSEGKLKRDRELVEYLKERVTSIYTEVKNESQNNQTEEKQRNSTTRRHGPRKPTTEGEGGS